MVFLGFLLFLAWPIAEIWIFIELGQAIGWIQAILLAIATSIAGTVFMRIQGLSALNRFLEGAERGELPVAAVLDGMGIFIAGVLLTLPGFLSDILGLFLFIPPVRRRLTAWLFRQFLHSGSTRGGAWRTSFGGRRAGAEQPGFRRAENVVDVEFETVDPRASPKEPSRVKKPGEESR